MAPATKKRALEADKPTSGSAKRVKAAGGRSRSRGAQAAKDKRQQKPRAAVSLDALNWKAAVLPDRLEDAEGFLGLEEVDDVEVIRNGELGKVEYRVIVPFLSLLDYLAVLLLSWAYISSSIKERKK